MSDSLLDNLDTIDREPYIRPSSLGPLSKCEGRALAEAIHVEMYGQPKSAQEAELGNELHDYSDRAVKLWRDDGMEWGDAIALVCNEATQNGVDGWSVGVLQHGIEYVRDLIVKYNIEKENVLTEHRLDMSTLGFKKGGTADVVLVVPHELVIVVDYKYGFVDQGDAEDHDQLQAYAIAAALTYDAKQALVYLNQPRAEKQFRLSGAKFDLNAIRKNLAWTQSVIKLARGDNPQFTAGYDQCKHCRALTTCAEARRYIMDAREALKNLTEPMNDSEAGALADAAKLAEEFSDRGKNLIRDRLKAGGAADGWKLGNPRATRIVTDVVPAFERLEEAGFRDEALEACTLKIGGLSKPALDIIADHIGEKLAEPPLTQNKRSKVA